MWAERWRLCESNTLARGVGTVKVWALPREQPCPGAALFISTWCYHVCPGMEDGLQDRAHPPVVFLLSGVSCLKKSWDPLLFLSLKIRSYLATRVIAGCCA